MGRSQAVLAVHVHTDLLKTHHSSNVQLMPRTSAELLRENKRLIDKSIREIDRERNSLQMQENKLIIEMKKNAKNGQMVRHAVSPTILVDEHTLEVGGDRLYGRICPPGALLLPVCKAAAHSNTLAAAHPSSSSASAGLSQSTSQVAGTQSPVCHQNASHESEPTSCVTQDHGVSSSQPSDNPAAWDWGMQCTC